jgi:hypothetical protein
LHSVPSEREKYVLWSKQLVKKLLIPATLMAVVLGLTACYQGNLSGPRVAVLGDSITDISHDAIASALAPNYAYNIGAHGGYTFANQSDELQTLINDPAGVPNDLVINLGSNDVFQYSTNGDTWRVGYQQVMGIAGFVGACVVVVNVNTYADDLVVGAPPVAEQINSAIDASVASDPRFHLLDWNAFIHEGTNFDEYIAPLSDFGLNVHPNVAGQVKLADMIRDALHQDCT